MKSKVLLIACAVALVSPRANAGGADLSAYGTPVDPTVPVIPRLLAAPNEPPNKNWPAHVCAEIQRVETSTASGFGPDIRGISRIGLLTLEARHCGIDVSKKMDADQAAMEDAHRASQRSWDDITDAAQRAASSGSREPIILQVPQAAPEPTVSAPPAPLNCFTTRLGGGSSSTTCR